jgi:hypothetical protein
VYIDDLSKIYVVEIKIVSSSSVGNEKKRGKNCGKLF